MLPRVGVQVSSLPLTFKNKQVFFPLCEKTALGLAQFYRHLRPGQSAKNSLLPFSHTGLGFRPPRSR